MDRRHFLKMTGLGLAGASLWSVSGAVSGVGPALAANVQANAQDGFLLLPGGSFMMGSPESERQRQADEVRHRVELDAFHVDPFEVTQGDYEAVMGSNPSANRGKRLLTEAEWEYACRAGTDTIFNVGNQVHSDKVNFEATYPYLIEENYVTQRDPSVEPSHYRGSTMKVDSLKPNAFGLCHTHGNVSEWVFDYYGPYETGVSKNPAGPTQGTYRVNRGGSYIDFGKHLRSAYRSATNPIDPDPNLGFRICRNANPLDTIVRTEAPRRIAMPAHPKMLVAFFSYTGNTERAAKIMSQALGATLFEIAMQRPYRGNIYEVSQEDLNNNARPALKGDVADFASYDVVLLGYPTWWATMPMPVYTFLESHDLAGKIVLPFSSHGGTVFGDSVSDLAKAIPNAYVGRGFEFHYSGGRRLENHIREWLKTSGLEAAR